MDRKGFFFSSAVMYVGAGISVVLMAAFYGFSLRVGTEAFGAMQSTLSFLFLLAASKGSAASYVVIHAAGNARLLPAVARRGSWLSLSVGAAVALLFAALAPALGAFLHLASPTPFLLIGAAAIPAVLSGTCDGVLNVQRRFAWLSVSSFLVPLANVAFAAALLRDGFQETDAGWIVLGSQVVGCLNAAFVDWKPLLGAPPPARRPAPLLDVGTLLVASLFFGASLKLDVLWARHLLTEEAAGSYAIASSVAVVLYLITGSVARVAAVSLRSGAGGRVIASSYALIAATSVALAAGFALAGQPFLRVLAGRSIAIDWWVLLPLFAAFTFFSTIQFDYSCLNAVHKRVHVGIGIVLVAAQAVALWTLGTDARSIAWSQCAVMAALAAAFSVWLVRAARALPQAPTAHAVEPHLAHQG